jgi:hypothetical protein
MYETPFQSIGARGVNNLASKLLLAILPPGSSFFRLTLDDFVVAKLAQKFKANPKLGDDARATLEEALGRIERAVCNRLEQVGARTIVFEALKQLLVAGNALVQILPSGKLQLHMLSNYVVKRDMSGNVLEIVVKQSLSRMSLPLKVLAIVEADDKAKPNDKSAEKNIDLYTRVSRKESDTGVQTWEVYQEACGKIVPDTQGTYPLDKTPWLPLRFTHITNEDYGRGFVEEYQGDMSSLESLTEAVVRFSVVAAKVVYLVDESGTTDKNKLAAARSGDVMDGKATDVTAVTLEKYNDFKVTKEVADGIQHRLEQAFLLDTAVQRDAERVTAEEIRLLANSLEMGLGGFYSILGEEFQRPLVSCMMSQMERERKLPILPKQAVNPSIVTGLEALGRNADLQRLDVLLQGLAQNFGPPVVAQYVDVGGYLKRRGTALGIDMTGLIRSDDAVQAQVNQQQQHELVQKLGPTAIKAGSDQATAAAQNGPPQQAPPQQ